MNAGNARTQPLDKGGIRINIPAAPHGSKDCFRNMLKREVNILYDPVIMRKQLQYRIIKAVWMAVHQADPLNSGHTRYPVHQRGKVRRFILIRRDILGNDDQFAGTVLHGIPRIGINFRWRI